MLLVFYRAINKTSLLFISATPTNFKYMSKIVLSQCCNTENITSFDNGDIANE